MPHRSLFIRLPSIDIAAQSRKPPKSARAANREVKQSAMSARGVTAPPKTRLEDRYGIVFAAKTTASALIALLVAFTFNLDQPYWALLTVFIVSQPQQGGPVLAKCFYRVIGTMTGAAAALFLVALCAQERVLFLGGLALWIGVCTFGSQYARNFVAYSFVLSGYTAAIVGIPGALDPGNAFYIAVGRVTEISLGIIVAATVSQVVLPKRLAVSLWQAIADARTKFGDYAIALLGSGASAPLRTQLLSQAISIENMRASAIFEDREIRYQSATIEFVESTLIRLIGLGQLLGRELEIPGRPGITGVAGLHDAMSEAAGAITQWRDATIDAASLSERLDRIISHLPSPQQAYIDPAPDDVVVRRIAARAHLCQFLTGMTGYAAAYEGFVAGRPLTGRHLGFARGNDAQEALWTGLRAALAVVFVSSFWILSNWPHGSTATVLAAVATARLATMGPAVLIAGATTLIFAAATIPAFIIIEVLLPLADGYGMFALVVGPMLFLCALLMAHKKTMLIGYMSALLFASAGQFLNGMVYDPIGMLNTCVAAIVAGTTAMVLWAVVAPVTPEAARRRFVRTARKTLMAITASGPMPNQFVAFETALADALDQLRGRLQPNRPEDIAVYEAGIALLSAGQDLINLRAQRGLSSSADDPLLDIAQLVHVGERDWLERARSTLEAAVSRYRLELRDQAVSIQRAEAASREIVAHPKTDDARNHDAVLRCDQTPIGTRSDAA